jgi:hypothetical protein
MLDTEHVAATLTPKRALRAKPKIDVALVVVIQAWPRLPEAIRAGILAMVRVAG